MRKWLVITLVVIFLLIMLPIGALTLVTMTKPDVGPAPDLTVTATPELLARGEYIYKHMAACNACHTPSDATRYSFPPLADKIGSGGNAFGKSEGVPGVIYASNITPAGIGTWSDGEVYRALVSGVTKDGKALFPLMPYEHYAKLSVPDLHAVIAYLRTLPSIANAVPERQLSFPMNVIVRLIPKPATPPLATPATTDLGYGAYITNAAACLHCHTRSNHGKVEPGKEFSGGVEFPMPDGSIVRSANLTPHEETGLGKWTKEQFIQRFRSSIEMAKEPLPAGAFNSLMPWTSYAGMTDADLGAIYDYLKTLPAVPNQVEKLTPKK